MEESTIYNIAKQQDPLEVYVTAFYKEQTGKDPAAYWTPALSAKLVTTVRHHDAVDRDRRIRAIFEQARTDLEASRQSGNPNWPPAANVIASLETKVLNLLKQEIDANRA